MLLKVPEDWKPAKMLNSMSSFGSRGRQSWPKFRNLSPPFPTPPFFQSQPRRQNRPPSHRRKKRHHAAFFPPPNHVQTLPCSSPVPQHHFPRDGDREDAIFAMIPPRKLKISPRRGSWTGNGALEAVDGVQGRLTAPWRRQRPATLVACPVAGPAGLYGRTVAENKGWHGIIMSHGLDGRGISAAEAFMNVKEVEWMHHGV